MALSKLELQSSCFDNIKTLCVNYGKDSSTRKTEDYLNKRLTSLKQQWEDFQVRHGELQREIEDRNINYFMDDIYGKTKEMYESTMSDIMMKLKIIQQQKPVKFDLSGISLENMNEDFQTILNKQECNFKAIDRVMSKISITSTSEKWELEDQLATMKAKWEVIDKLHWEIDLKLKGSNEAYYELFLGIEQKYDELRKKMNAKIWSTVHYQQSAPKMDIPQFAGDYHQWISFKDLFLETIHNNPTISTTQKMQHLKTKLRGEAEKLVQHLSLSADNYKSCWEILTQRYDNRRLQFTSYMNTMLNIPTIVTPDAYNLKKLHDVITECLNGITNIGLDTATWDPVIVHLMSQKLDHTTYNEYIKDLHDHREIQNLQDFLFFLESKFMAYESMKTTKKENTPKISYSKPNYKHYFMKKPNLTNWNDKKTFTKTYHTYSMYSPCPCCDGKHVLMQCPKFLEMDIGHRNHTVSKLHLCKNCLFSHGNADCTSSKTCKECNLRHHTLLHNASNKIAPIETNKGKSNFYEYQRPSTSAQQHSSNHLASDDLEVLLTTVQLEVQSADGTYISLRALLDQGSQVNLITENAAQLLRIPRKKLNATVKGIGSVSGDCRGRLQLTCKSIHSDYTFETEALIMKKLTNNLPNSTLDKTNWSHLSNLKLADPDFNISRPIDLLLGADVYSQIILNGVLKGDEPSPVAQQTQLGWVLCGKMKTFNCCVTLINLEELTKFWESEDIQENCGDNSRDECEDFYKKTVRRTEDGKYIVEMPTIPNYAQKLGNSRSVAISQFLQLEKRFERNKKLAAMYKDFMKEYEYLEHMMPTRSSAHMTASGECYLPHHGVLRENSTTTKLRTVFNASQKTGSGFSLNNLLEKGANLQKDIQALILKWRTYKYAFTADIEKMYRCIWLTEHQQQLQKIIWRYSPHDILREYQLCTVTYGTKCAPWLAMRTLKQLAIDDGHKYPPATADVLQNEFYMDDLISGHDSLEEAKQLQHSLIQLLKGAGMNLRKWNCNTPALLENLTEDQISKQNFFDFKNEESTKTLGLGWKSNTDTFNVNWPIPEHSKGRFTKRSLLAEISKLYDPLGWLSPVTVTAKLIFQKLWLSKLEWDDFVPENIEEEWLKLKSELTFIKNITLNRWIGGSDTRSVELLGFCDASERAYACVIYSRVRNVDGNYIITLLASRTKVAPVSQKTTLPRLELCGALLLSDLMKKTVETLSKYNLTVRAWCDSQVVLAWVKGDTSRWDTYVANRVTKIKKNIPADQWSYIKSEQNPADCASRGLLPSKLATFDLWWQSPEFLRTPEKIIETETNMNLERIRSEQEIITATTYLNSASFTAYLLISKLKYFQEMLLNTLTNVYQGHIDVHLITPVVLTEQLQEIAGRLPRTLSLPIDDIREDIKDIYRLLYVKARVTENYFFLEIHFPLISDDDYTLYRVIPLPIKWNQETTYMQMSSKYIAVNFRKNLYLSLTEADLKQCLQQKQNNFICHKNLPVYNLHNNNGPCEAKLLSHHSTLPCDVTRMPCKDAWIELHAPNSWLVVCCDKCTIRTICNNDVTSNTIASSQIITLSQGCELQTRDTTIYSHNQYKSEIKLDYNINIPTLNNSINQLVNLTHRHIPRTYQPSYHDIEVVNRDIENLKQHMTHLPTTISSHDVHQYSISYFMLIASIIVVLFVVGRKRYRNYRRAKQNTKELNFETIELQEIRCTNRPVPDKTSNDGQHVNTASLDFAAGANNIAFNFD